MASEIKYCTDCARANHTHEFQDAKYGKFFRVFNGSEKGGNMTCTVCGSGKRSKK